MPERIIVQKTTKVVLAIIGLLIAITFVPALYKTVNKELGNIREPKTKVGIICINGEITEIGKYTKYLQMYFEDKSIKAILLKIESPGGYAGSSEALFNEITELKKEYPKPIITYIQNLCASGAYLTACATDYIVSTPSATVGSVGAVLGYFKLKDFMQQWKVDYKIHKGGDYKTTLNPFTDATEEGDALLNSMSEAVYMHFAKEVARARKLSMNDLKTWANGKVFTGAQAKEIGLVDAIGSECTAIKKIKEVALIDGKIEFIKPAKPTLMEQLTGKSDDDCTTTKSLLETVLTNIFREQLLAKL